MGKTRIPTLIGLFFLVLGLFVGVFVLNSQQLFRLGADEDSSPKNIRVSNITDTSLTITWTTQKETFGFVTWGTQSATTNTTLPKNTKPDYIHTITLTGLAADSEYFYRIHSDGVIFENSKTPWQTKTAQALNLPNKAVVASGTIISDQGLPVDGALVYVTSGGSSLLTTQSRADGSWFVTLSNARNQTLDDFIVIDEKKTLIEIFVQAGPKGSATATIYPESANPTPPIQLGQIHNFKNLAKTEDIIPEVSLAVENLPDIIDKKLPVSINHPIENEIFLTSKFEFSGRGEEVDNLTIIIKEADISDAIQIDNLSNWSWTPSTRLANGRYALILTWSDQNAEPNSLTRNFTVKTEQ